MIAIFDPTSKGNNVKNSLPNSIKYSSLLYKCENYLNEKYLQDISDVIFEYSDEKDLNYQNKFIKDFLMIYRYCKENKNKELFTLNDIIKYKIIYEMTLKKNIIDYETLIQILLLYRFSNIDDIEKITSKLGFSLEKDLWPTVKYIAKKKDNLNVEEEKEEKEKEEEEEEEEDEENNIISQDKIIEYFIRISPMKTNKFLSYKLPPKSNIYEMENLKRKLFSLTPEQRMGLIFLMISLKTNLTCIIQGPSASGKSHLIKLFCEILGEEPEIIELNNDSGINLLTWQIAPKSNIEDEDENEIQKALEECKIIDKIYSIVNKNNFINEPLKWKPKNFHQILKELELIKKELNEKELNIVKRIENKFINELSFLKHLKNQDSPFINALTNDKWVILDGIESAQAELYERLSSLCDLSNKS